MEGLLQRVKRKSFELMSLPSCSRNYIPGGRKMQCLGLKKWSFWKKHIISTFKYQNSCCMILSSSNTGLSSGVTPLDFKMGNIRHLRRKKCDLDTHKSNPSPEHRKNN